MKSIAAPAAPQALAIVVLFNTWLIMPAWTTITHAMSKIIDRSNGLLPILSIRNHGMNEAKKNQVNTTPDIRAAVFGENPILCWKIVELQVLGQLSIISSFAYL